jgi:predicted MFS family arabinose efflux permease
MAAKRMEPGEHAPNRALRFVLLLGAVSFFADFTYEGARAVTGPFLAVLGAGGFAAATVGGAGELLGYGLRWFSGRYSERTQRFWPVALAGYLIQMAAVPLLAIAGSWQVAAALILLERVGKATRNPPRDVMLSHAARRMGFGWGFGVHEALDQLGALFGPLAVALALAHGSHYRAAFAMLLVPAIVTYSLLLFARRAYPDPEQLEATPPREASQVLPRRFWIYLSAAALAAAGFADFQLVAFHLHQARVVGQASVPLLYALAMGVSGAGSLLFGRLFDRYGVGVLIPLTLVSAASGPLLFLGGQAAVILGMAIWGMGMGVHESIIPAAVATIVPAARRPSAYGLFTAVYGASWFLGSVSMGALYAHSLGSVAALSLSLELAAIPMLWFLRGQ